MEPVVPPGPVCESVGVTGRKVGVPSEVVDTMGLKKREHFSNSWADIFLTGVVDPETGAKQIPQQIDLHLYCRNAMSSPEARHRRYFGSLF